MHSLYAFCNTLIYLNFLVGRTNLKIMRNAFVCCTPYHVIVSIHLIQSIYSGENNEIFISNHFENSFDIYKNLKKQKLFKAVYYVTDRHLSYDDSFLKWRKIYGLFSRTYQSIISDPVDFNYDNVFLFTYSYFSVLITDLVKKNNKFSEINMVEEGTLTYMLGNYDIVDNIRFYADFIGKTVLNRRFLNPNILNAIYLFQPNLYNGELSHKLKKIPSLKISINIQKLLNHIFNFEEQGNFVSSKYLFFDQSFSIDGNRLISEFEVVKSISDILPRDEILIKLHPRDSKDKYKSFNINVNSSNFPWELIYYNYFKDIKNKVLISVSSSSVFTPKILFNCEHDIILLYKIFGKTDRRFVKFVNKFKTIYKKKNVYEPETLNEFQQIVKNLRNSL